MDWYYGLNQSDLHQIISFLSAQHWFFVNIFQNTRQLASLSVDPRTSCLHHLTYVLIFFEGTTEKTRCGTVSRSSYPKLLSTIQTGKELNSFLVQSQLNYNQIYILAIKQDDSPNRLRFVFPSSSHVAILLGSLNIMLLFALMAQLCMV